MQAITALQPPRTDPRLLGSLHALVVALGIRDAYTRSHCDRSADLAAELGRACGVLNGDMDILRVSAQFHDIGKIGVPDAVLLKPERLTDEEWALMKSHAEHGEHIFNAGFPEDEHSVAKVIRHHHQSFDGSGYPDGLRGKEIPYLSRILLVVDSYDAMSTARPYHSARTHHEIMNILAAECGQKIDPDVFRAFARLIEDSPNRAQ